jgi:hypothetical protein
MMCADVVFYPPYNSFEFVFPSWNRPFGQTEDVLSGIPGSEKVTATRRITATVGGSTL